LSKRKELALHIRSFAWEVGPEFRKDSVFPGMHDIEQELRRSARAVCQTIGNIVCSQQSDSKAELAAQLFKQLYTVDLVDAAIALVLCMAKNLECFFYRHEQAHNWGQAVRSRALRTVLGFEWQGPRSRPFEKLKHVPVCFWGSGRLTSMQTPVVLPSMSSLHLVAFSLRHPLFRSPLHYPYTEDNVHLRELKLDEMGMGPAQMVIPLGWV
jgi:hypothetical protein